MSLESAVVGSFMLSGLIAFILGSLFYIKIKRRAYLDEHTKPYHELRIKVDESHPEAEAIKTFYRETLDTLRKPDDSGVDLYSPVDFELSNTCKLMHFGFSAEFVAAGSVSSSAYWLVPRSSIYKTLVVQANNIGIIDAGYRGPLCVPVYQRYTPTNPDDVKQFGEFPPYSIDKGTRLFQIIAPDGAHIRVRLVDSLSDTVRGAGGFGSTGK
jgi:dUTP pyrophosphatase